MSLHQSILQLQATYSERISETLTGHDLRIGITPRVAVYGDEVVGPVLGGDDAGNIEQALPRPVAEGLFGGGISGALAARHDGGAAL